jgi:3-oxoacyl-[acyl-carrier protein] reductase
MGRLDGKIAIITGGGSGIGRGIALRFAAEGAKIAIGEINAEAGATVARAIDAQGGQALAVHTDVAQSAQVDELFRQTVARYGSVDVLVNNAGIAEMNPKLQERMQQQVTKMMSGGQRESLGITRDLSDEDWRHMLEVHLFGNFYCTRAALRIMEDQRSGSIINMASVAGLGGIPGAPHYGAAKAGIIGFTKSIAQEVGGAGIRVNAIAPGLIDTPMTAPIPPMAKHFLLMRVPLGREGTPADIAGVALFLASEDSAYVTGQVISPNGGLYT